MWQPKIKGQQRVNNLKYHT